MKGDFTRRTFDPLRHYHSVRMQRGRVQLDADWNEQVEIQLHRLEQLAADLTGPAATPGNERNRLPHDFSIDSGGASGPTVDAGRIYVGGVLCEMEERTRLDQQVDLPGYTLPREPGRYLAYLDVWEDHVTALDDPSLAEPTLGGADSTTRGHLVCQVKLLKVPDAATRDLFPPGVWNPLGTPPPPPFRLAARSRGTPAGNQLYRLEIHRGGGLGTATFKWSRDNGIAVAPVTGVAGMDVTLASRPGLDPARLFAPGQWIEVSSRARELRGETGALARLLRVGAGVLTVEGWPAGPPAAGADRVRRWDSPGDLPIAIPPANEGFLPLEEGVEITFSGGALEQAVPGDYWLIPVRSAAGALWPVAADGTPRDMAPAGTYHRYAPLALLDFDLTGNGHWHDVGDGDCRLFFTPATSIPVTNKVDRSGDEMTGPLTIDSHLLVTGQAHLGGLASPPAGVRLQVSAGRIAVAGGALRIPMGADQATLGSSNGNFVVGVASLAGSVRIFQNGDDRLVVAGSKVGLGVTEPQADLDVGGKIRAGSLQVDGNLTLVLEDGSQGVGRVLTAVDNSGHVQWRSLPPSSVLRPVFFQAPIVVQSSGGSSDFDFVPYSFPSDSLPPTATAVILEAYGIAADPDSDAIDHYIRIRKDGGSPVLVLLRGRSAGSGDSAAWAGQGVFPVNAGSPQFQYSVRAFNPFNSTFGGGGFPGGWRIRVIGYFL